MLMKMSISTFDNPTYNSENSARDGYCNERSKEHLIFSFRMNEICNSNVGYKECVDTDSHMGRKFNEEFTGKGSCHTNFGDVHQAFCQKLFSSSPYIHAQIIAQLNNYVKQLNEHNE